MSNRIPADAEAGLGGLLKTWRAAAGAKSGRMLTQDEVARRAERSVRWYRGLENAPRPKRLTEDGCIALATALDLGSADQEILHRYRTDGKQDAVSPKSVTPGVRLLLDAHTAPAYVCDRAWRVLGYNATGATWWPWVQEPDANFMRWALVSPQGRAFHDDWPVHAAQYVTLIRFALATYPDDADLAAIVREVRTDPDVQRIWEETARAAEHCHGHVYNMTVPAVSPSPIPLLGHLTYPADMPGCRLVVLTAPEG